MFGLNKAVGDLDGKETVTEVAQAWDDIAVAHISVAHA